MNSAKGLKITIVEADSDMSADEAFKRLGYAELAKKYSIKLKNISDDRVVKLLLPKSKKLSTLEVPENTINLLIILSQCPSLNVMLLSV